MQSRDFCFWLQGYFELTPDVETLDRDQTLSILAHLQLTLTHERALETKASQFCTSLKGFFARSYSPVFAKHEVEWIKTGLNEVFEHEIDPAMGGPAHQDKLNNIHTPARPPLRPGETLLRC